LKKLDRKLFRKWFDQKPAKQLQGKVFGLKGFEKTCAVLFDYAVTSFSLKPFKKGLWDRIFLYFPLFSVAIN
jgi:hypothetical protein